MHDWDYEVEVEEDKMKGYVKLEVIVQAYAQALNL